MFVKYVLRLLAKAANGLFDLIFPPNRKRDKQNTKIWHLKIELTWFKMLLKGKTNHRLKAPKKRAELGRAEQQPNEHPPQHDNANKDLTPKRRGPVRRVISPEFSETCREVVVIAAAIVTLLIYLGSFFDKNDDGKVSEDEMPDWMRERMLERVDTNGDGAIDREEAEAVGKRMRGAGGPGGGPGERPRRPRRPDQE